MGQADAIAAVVLEEFDKLPANRKPAVRSNGVSEWVPLSGIVAELKGGELVCLALATGMKCLSASKLSLAKGVGIHDWHAEVLALRAFNRFVLQECRDVLLCGDESPFLQHRQRDGGMNRGKESCCNDDGDGKELPWISQPFEWRADIALHMYCSEAPCGDASMELTMAAQEDASPWATPATTVEDGPGNTVAASAPLLAGRGYFSRLGAVRRKPGRADAPPTLSKSCSDKLALRQCVTLLSGLVSLLVAPSPSLCLRSVILPVTQYSETGCRRCFSAAVDIGRMSPVVDYTWPGGYAFMPLTVRTTSLEFAYSKRKIVDASRTSSSSSPSTSSSNMSIAWTLNGISECLVGGVLRGRKAFNPAGASAVSRRQMWKLAQEVTDEALRGCSEEGSKKSIEQLQNLFRATTYTGVKTGGLLAARERVKEDVKASALRGWTRNESDRDWGLDTL